jgi:hypothetical protein
VVVMLICGDALTAMNKMRPKSVDLVFTSPPYEDCRTYGIGFDLKGQEWVDWCVAWIGAATRVCRGLIAVVVAGKTRNYKWSATPALLMADLHRAGFNLRKPPIYNRIGVSGSGGPDWLRSHWTNGNAELCLFAKRGRPKRICKSVKQIQIWPRGRHSAKPPQIRDEIIRLVGDLPRIELFARTKTPGWDVFGNEVKSDIQLETNNARP